MTSRTPEEQLIDLLRSLREETSDERPSPDVEARLMEEFGRQQTTSGRFRHRHSVALPPQPAHRASAAATWLAIAASVAVVVAAAAGMRTWLSPASNGTPSALRQQGRPPAARRQPQPLEARALRPDIDHAAAVVPPQLATVVQPPPAGQRRASSRPGKVVEFVAWPGAAALPSLESGELMRIDLPASVLPLLGLASTASAGQAAVPADVIVGQDGRPRAVRLVSDER